jgi:gamma-glutamyltranspeptidase/glutathione hydrolase
MLLTRRTRLAPLVALTISALAGISCHRAPSTNVPAVQAAAFPGGWADRRRRPPVVAEHAIVVSNSELASAAGAEIMKRGGNAVDAAVATGFALAVTYPFAGNIGGGGFMVIRMADGRAAAIDYREVAPLAATRDMYLDASGKLTDKSLVGGLAVGVPGAVAGMAEALAKFGTMSLHDVMQPAIRLASDGFTVDSALYRSVNGSRRLIGQFAGAKVFLPNGQAPAPGSVLKQPDSPARSRSSRTRDRRHSTRARSPTSWSPSRRRTAGSSPRKTWLGTRPSFDSRSPARTAVTRCTRCRRLHPAGSRCSRR